MKPFKWIKKHPFEALALTALAGTGLGAAGIGPMAGLFGTGAAGAAGGMAAGEGLGMLGAGEAASLMGGAGGMAAGEGLGMLGAGEAASLMAPQMAASSPLLGNYAGMFGPQAGGSSLGSQLLSGMGPSNLIPQVASPTTLGAAPFAQGAVTTQPGMAGLFGPSTQAANVPWLTSEQALQLARMVGQLGGGQGQQQPMQPMGAPQDMTNPMQRPAFMTQEQITKKWLLQNDPATYARIYGAPQGAA